MFRKLLCNGYRAVLSAGAANGNYQLALLFVVAVERNHIVDKVIEPCQKACVFWESNTYPELHGQDRSLDAAGHHKTGLADI